MARGLWRHGVQILLTALAASAAAAAAPDELGRLDQLNQQAVELEAAGRGTEARRLFDEALSGFRHLGDREGQTIVLGNLGALLESSGDYDGALAHFEEAEAVADSATGPEAAAWAPRRAAIARINQATALEKTSDYSGAFERLRQDLEHPETLEGPERVGLWTNAGVLVRNLGDPRQALRLFDRAWEAAREHGDLATQANVRLNRGLAWSLDLDSPAEARREFTAAAELARRSGDHAEIVQTLFYLGRFELTQGRTIAAEAAFATALGEARESDNAEGRWSALEGLGRVALERHDPRRAAQLFAEAVVEIERTRRRLTDRRGRAGYFGDRRGAYEGWIHATLSEGSEDAATRAVEIAEAARARDLLDTWRSDGGSPTRLQARTDRPPSLAFFSVDGRLLRFLLEGSSVLVSDRGATEDLRQLAERVAARWSQGRADPAERELGDHLLGELPSRARWNVVLDHALASLPIDALPEAGGAPWFETASVALWPSLAALDRSAQTGPRPPGSLRYLGLGSPQAKDLEDLPASRAEIEAARRRFAPSAAVRLDTDATEQSLREAGSVDLLHLATHAVRRSGETALRLSPAGRDDGWLTASEIVPLRLSVGTVLLSACRAGGDGVDRRGSALSGLTGAFLAAGARGVIAPLWDVRDSDAAAISEQLTARLARGNDPVEALRAVKRALRADPRWASPNRWAAWVAIGAPEALHPVRGRGGGGGIALVAAGLVAVALWLRTWFSGRRGRRPRS